MAIEKIPLCRSFNRTVVGAYIEPLALTASDVADSLGVHRATFSRLLNGKIDVTPEMAMRLSDVFGGSPESWINMQISHTLARLRNSDDWQKGKPTKPIKAISQQLSNAAAW